MMFSLTVLALAILMTWGDVWAGGKHRLPVPDEGDLEYYLEPQPTRAGEQLYLYSSLSFLSRSKDAATFTFALHPDKTLSPLISLGIRPEFDHHIRSEYFDFTIWGQLGNLFNTTIEFIELENEILSMLSEIEKVNKKFAALLDSTSGIDNPLEIVPTLSKANYFDYENQPSEQCRDNEEEKSPCKTIQRKSTPALQPRLKSSILSLAAATASQHGPQAAQSYVRYKDRDEEFENNPTATGGIFVSLFRAINVVLKYLLANKFESAIYLFCLLSLSAFVKVLLTRQGLFK